MRKKRILFLLLLLLGVSILWAGRLQRERTGTAENLTKEENLSSDVQEMPQETADITPVQRMTQMQGACAGSAGYTGGAFLLRSTFR